jgi:hypothetical protein
MIEVIVVLRQELIQGTMTVITMAEQALAEQQALDEVK